MDMKFPAVLRTLRKERKVSQLALAEALGLTQQAIGRWEAGKNYPDIATLVRLSDFFHVSTDYLLGKGELRQLYSRTGEGSGGWMAVLTPEEARVLARYRSLNKEGRGKADDLLLDMTCLLRYNPDARRA